MVESRTEDLRTMPYEEYLRTPEWAERRANAIHRASYRCQICNSPHSLHVHHRTYENRGDERLEDLTVLCDNCHTLYHRQDATSYQLLTVEEYVQAELELHSEATRGSMRGIPTMFADLDRLLGGMQRGDLLVVAGRPSVGKTALAVGFVVQASVRLRQRCLIFSPEMSSSQLTQRMLAMLSDVATHRIQSGSLAEDEHSRFLKACDHLASAPIFVDDTPAIQPRQIRARAFDLSKDLGLDLIVVDCLELLSDDEPNASQYQSIANKVRSLKALAKELNIPVVLVTQLGAHVEKRIDKRPILNDLAGSLDADVVMFIYRDELYHENTERRNIADIIVANHRNGPIGTMALYFSKELPRFVQAETHRDQANVC